MILLYDINAGGFLLGFGVGIVFLIIILVQHASHEKKLDYLRDELRLERERHLREMQEQFLEMQRRNLLKEQKVARKFEERKLRSCNRHQLLKVMGLILGLAVSILTGKATKEPALMIGMAVVATFLALFSSSGDDMEG